MGELVPGVYERLVTAGLEAQLRDVAADLVERARLDPGDADVELARHLGLLARRALRSLPAQSGAEGGDLVDRQVALANRMAAAILSAAPDASTDADLVAAGELLREILARTGAPGNPEPLDRPMVPLSASALLVNGRDQPRIGSEVQRELASADRVDLLCAFVKWHGLRVLEDQLAELVRRRRAAGEPSPPLRVITTTYIGATERRALDRLVELGAEVKVSYETRMTRLHAKAWLFHRDTGYSTAYVGSSNLSKSALLDGLEWNVRLAEVDQGHLLDTFRATFDEYWEDPAFETVRPDRRIPTCPARRGAGGRERRPGRSADPAHDIGCQALGLPARDPRRTRRRAGDPRASPQPGGDGNGHGQDRRRRTRLPPAARCRAGRTRCCSWPTATRS